MPRWKLIPTSGLAAELTQDVHLTGTLKIGRNVTGPDTLILPAGLTQFSGVHCRVYPDLSSGSVQWFVEDTSTNGTFVDGERIMRNTSARLMEGSRLRLSSPPQDVLEFEFMRDEADDERGDNYSHYSRPQHHGLQQHQMLPYGAHPVTASAGALTGFGKAHQSHAAYGMTSGAGGAGASTGAGAAGAAGGEGLSVPSNPQLQTVSNKRKVSELNEGGDDVPASAAAAAAAAAAMASAAAPTRNVMRRMNSTGAGGGGGVTMSYGMPQMGMAGGGTAAAAAGLSSRPSPTTSFYPGGMGLGGGGAGAGASAEHLVHLQAQLRAEKSEKEGLKRQAEQLRREYDDVARNLAALREEHARQLDRSATERQTSASREESLRSMLAAAEARAELVSRQADQAAERARGELAEAETGRRHAEREAADAKVQLAAAREELERLSAELRAERSDAAAQRAAAAAARREAESVREALGAEQKDKKAEQERAERLQQQVEVEKASAAAARRMAEQHEGEVRAARTQAEDEQRGRRAACEEALSLRGQMEDTRRQLGEAHERISALQDELATRHHRLRGLSKSHAQAQQLLSGLQQTVAAMAHMHSSMGHQYAEALASAAGSDFMPGGGGGGDAAGGGGGGDGDGHNAHGAGHTQQQQMLGVGMSLAPQTETTCTDERTGVLALGDNSAALRQLMQSQLGGSLAPPQHQQSHMGMGIGTMQLHHSIPGFPFPAPTGHGQAAGANGAVAFGSADPAGLLITPCALAPGGATPNLTQQLHMMSQQQHQHQQQHPGFGLPGAIGRPSANPGGSFALTGGASQPLPPGIGAGMGTPQLPSGGGGRGGTQPGSFITPHLQALPASQQQLPPSQQQFPQLGCPDVTPTGAVFPGTCGASQLPPGSLPPPSQQQQQHAAGDPFRTAAAGTWPGQDVKGGGGGNGAAPSCASASQNTTPAPAGGGGGAAGAEERQDESVDGGGEDDEEGVGYTSRMHLGGAAGAPCGAGGGGTAAGAMEVDCPGTSDTPRKQEGGPEVRNPQSQQVLLGTPAVAQVPVGIEGMGSGGAPRRSSQQAVPNGAAIGAAAAAAPPAPGHNVPGAWPRLFSRHLTPTKPRTDCAAADYAAATAAAGAVGDGDAGATPASRPRGATHHAVGAGAVYLGYDSGREGRQSQQEFAARRQAAYGDDGECGHAEGADPHSQGIETLQNQQRQRQQPLLQSAELTGTAGTGRGDGSQLLRGFVEGQRDSLAHVYGTVPGAGREGSPGGAAGGCDDDLSGSARHVAATAALLAAPLLLPPGSEEAYDEGGGGERHGRCVSKGYGSGEEMDEYD